MLELESKRTVMNLLNWMMNLLNWMSNLLSCTEGKLLYFVKN
jgi:hypothetical protein